MKICAAFTTTMFHLKLRLYAHTGDVNTSSNLLNSHVYSLNICDVEANMPLHLLCGWFSFNSSPSLLVCAVR